MRRINESTERKNRNIRTIIFSIVMLCVGYYILNYVATLEKPPLGETFNIILGCVIIAVSSIIIYLTINKQFFSKRRRNRTKQVFLEDQTKNENPDKKD